MHMVQLLSLDYAAATLQVNGAQQCYLKSAVCPGRPKCPDELTIKSKASRLASPASSKFRKTCAVMTKTWLCLINKGHEWALTGLYELKHSTPDGMFCAALNAPAQEGDERCEIVEDARPQRWKHLRHAANKQTWSTHKDQL